MNTVNRSRFNKSIYVFFTNKKRLKKIRSDMRSFYYLFLFVLMNAVIVPSAKCEEMRHPEQKEGTIKGYIIDSESQSPLTGVNISLMHTQMGAITDDNGIFKIEKLPVGNYILQFDYMGYQELKKTDIIVKSQRTTFIHVELKPAILDGEVITVSAGYFSAVQDQPVSAVNYSYEEIRRSPGSAGDVSRILAVLPSIAKVNDQSNSLVVRGGSPVENSFYIDNIEIPNINHYPTQGSSGGPISLLNVDFIREVNFYSGGFSAIHGDKLSSIMDISFREGNREEFYGQFDLHFAGFGFVGEGPILNKKGSWLFSARRSFLDLLVDAIGSGVAPRYSDYQGKVVYDINESNKLIALGVLGLDQIKMNKSEAAENGMIAYGSHNFTEGTFGINWQKIWCKNGYSNTSISYSGQRFENRNYETKSDYNLLNNNSFEHGYKIRNINHVRLNQSNRVEFGFDSEYLITDYDYNFAEYTNATGDTVAKMNNDKKIYGNKFGFFASHIMHPFSRLKTNFSLRADYFSYNKKYHLSPRLSFSYMLTGRTSINGSTGVFYQNLPLILLYQKEKYKDLHTPLAYHYILGLTHLLKENTKITIEIYKKDYQNLPLDPEEPSLFVLDELFYRYGVFFNHENLSDRGKAYSTGIEVTIQKKLANGLYGLISGTLFKTKYRGYDKIWRDRVFDNRAIFSVEGGYKPNNRWEFSLRWIYAGGVPYTPFDQTASKAINRAIFDRNRINKARYPDYHSLNVRFDRRFHFDRSNLIVYFSVWNAYNRKNISSYYWNEIENKQDTSYQWSSLPIFGIEYEF
jgi:hypothetical protein